MADASADSGLGALGRRRLDAVAAAAETGPRRALFLARKSGGLALAALSLAAPLAFAALVPAVLWGGWMQLKLGGQTGDVLGAGIEWSESVALLLAGVLLVVVGL